MTTIYFVRHAQSDFQWDDDETRPLTAEALVDRLEVEAFFAPIAVDFFYSSPYQRAVDTISTVAAQKGKPIQLDRRFRERTSGVGGQKPEMVRRRWEDFQFCEPGGECLSSVQSRNLEVLREILTRHPNQTLVVGTHGTALSTILNEFDGRFGLDDFLELIDLMPYVLKVTFDGQRVVAVEKQFSIRKVFRGKNNIKDALRSPNGNPKIV